MVLAGKTALVTGATSGIGAETARAFAREGATIVLTGRKMAEKRETKYLTLYQRPVEGCLNVTQKGRRP